MVEATWIYEDNITQFLQVNTLEGDNELKRVGNVVWKGTLPIEWAPEKVNQWVRTGLDLTELAAEYRSTEFTQISQGNIWYLIPVSMTHDS